MAHAAHNCVRGSKLQCANGPQFNSESLVVVCNVHEVGSLYIRRNDALNKKDTDRGFLDVAGHHRRVAGIDQCEFNPCGFEIWRPKTYAINNAFGCFIPISSVAKRPSCVEASSQR